jgi:hypothetical protein
VDTVLTGEQKAALEKPKTAPKNAPQTAPKP